MTESTNNTTADHDAVDDAYYQLPSKTFAFFVDARASNIALEATVENMIDADRIDFGLVDLNTIAGVTIAATLLKHEIPYNVLSFGATALNEVTKSAEHAATYNFDHDKPRTLDDAGYLMAHSQVVVHVSPERPWDIDASLVIVPSITNAGVHHIDLSTNEHGDSLDLREDTIPGYLMHSAQKAITEQPDQLKDSAVLVIDTPESGLVQLINGKHTRRIILVELGGSPADGTTEHDEATDTSGDAE